MEPQVNQNNRENISPDNLKQSFQETNKALSEYLRLVELHRTYYALKKLGTHNETRVSDAI